MRAPYIEACANFPAAILPLGTTTMLCIPHAAPKAEAEALVLPVEAQITPVQPSSSPLATATTIPRSLNEPVGFMPSSLK